ncbi:hypothetical protein BLL37_08300 [Pseudomonas azotoformans]|uniref:HNH nuclease domain-containing protein n=1 Tax=Pseudomonas azotoformans TaxID=47878 RepID=A0A1V2JND8_PSEAZ|nr:hypothetical protein [Pseudomonas azotoformans]OIN46957.1 hypothetical protein BFL39_17635 [Pseudomonas azotoformans]ONH46859.1 hypothetical protein BLL37_08300 [Pseudomonas azotoformans]SDM87710.1 TIGR02646 family protein [Pseudomonas azotoformans]
MRYVQRNLEELPEALALTNGRNLAIEAELAALAVYFEAKKKGKLVKADTAPKKRTAHADSEEKELVAKFDLYGHASVRAKLNDMFHGKCAYCESFYRSTSAMEVEHYRPKEGVVQDKGHTGYWWLGMAWDNLLPSCIFCNRLNTHDTPTLSAKLTTLLGDPGEFSDSRKVVTGKGNHFPVLGVRAHDAARDYSRELPLLLDPCRDNPSEHLRFYIEPTNIIGLILPMKGESGGLPAQKLITDMLPKFKKELTEALMDGLSLRGAFSIHIYGLNRLGLVQDRTRVLRHLRFMEGQVVDLSKVITDLESRPYDSNYQVDNQRILKCLNDLLDRTMRQMTSMADDHAPYSMMVRAYLKDLKKRL